MQSGGTMLLTLLVLVPLLTGLVCLPLRERAALGRLNLIAFVIEMKPSPTMRNLGARR